MAVDGALEPVVDSGPMNRRSNDKPVAASQDSSPIEALPAPTDSGKQKEKRRRRGASALEERIAYRFTNAVLLDSALSHISALKGSRNRANSYQRLEFLGDHVLGLVISDVLFRAFPKADEGELSRRLADLVRKETCAEIARTIDLGAAIRVGSSEHNAGARSRPAILADVCEAVIAAIYLDGGLPAAAAFIGRWWEPLIGGMEGPPRDPKTQLQEWAQARGLGLPAYRLVATEGPDHAPRFTVAASVAKSDEASATASSKRAAETEAAAALLQQLASPKQ